VTDIKVKLKNGVMRVYGLDQSLEKEIWRTVSSVARWHDKWRCWNIPLSYDSVGGLRKLTGSVPSGLEGWYAEQGRLDAARVAAAEFKTADPEKVRNRLAAVGVRFKKPLLDHQVLAAAFALKLPSCGLFMDTGTGKTATLATVMQALVDLRGYKKFLVMAPKSILGASWAADLTSFSWLRHVNISDPPRRQDQTTCPFCGKTFSRHVPWRHLKDHVSDRVAAVGEDAAKDELWLQKPGLKPPSSETREEAMARALSSDAQVFLINPEAFRLSFDVISDADWDMFIVDESSCLKNPKSQTTSKVLELGASVKRRIAATATPRPNSSLDLWGQMAFIDQALGGNFYSFREKYYQSDYTGFRWMPKTMTVDQEIRDIVFRRAIRFELDDCVSLPGETFETRVVELTKDLRKKYTEMSMLMSTTLKSGDQVSTDWMVVQLNKLSQITSGFLIKEDGSSEWLDDASPKIIETTRSAKSLIEDEGRSVVIWIRYQEEARTLQKALAEYGVSTMHGGTKDHEASAAAFKSGKNKVMIAHPASAKFGHTWVEHCNVAIFHSYDYSFENWYQARRRIYRIGQKRPVTYLTVAAENTIDQMIIKAVMDKFEGHNDYVVGNFIADLARRAAGVKSQS
jgi:SNF2 family DNA or RNA helicase